ncbi:holo-ACP synthase [Porphyrobacter sp. GA68]|uniref:holo-ACP synthase n=1 Tax=Porphyrobacter sp. GA68 TaxID=2883480 RepID=UPI001D18B919|nr:holo-ACP synthase [Porphyrobacter sp. GA68]
MILAHGIDLVDIPHTTALLHDPTDQFLTRCFTTQEQEAVGAGQDRAARLSGRLAVKEAVMKALGTGFAEGVGFLSIEVVKLPSGAPTIVLHDEAERRAAALGIQSWLVSTAHEGDIAVASVIGLGDQGAPR